MDCLFAQKQQSTREEQHHRSYNSVIGKQSHVAPKFNKETLIGDCLIHNCYRLKFYRENNQNGGWIRLSGIFEICPKCIDIKKFQGVHKDCEDNLHRFMLA